MWPHTEAPGGTDALLKAFVSHEQRRHAMKRSLSMHKMLSFLVAGSMAFLVLAVCSDPAMAQEGGIPEAIRTQKVAPQAVATNTCNTPRLSFASSDNIFASTTSTTFVDVPDMVVRFTIPGNTATCIVVPYTATVWTGKDELIYIRAQLDGAVTGFPAEVQFEGDSDEDGDGKWARAHAFSFVFPKVTPGAHTLRIQWRSFFGGTVSTHWRTVVVHHR
jgi:hypothetical protein